METRNRSPGTLVALAWSRTWSNISFKASVWAQIFWITPPALKRASNVCSCKKNNNKINKVHLNLAHYTRHELHQNLISLEASVYFPYLFYLFFFYCFSQVVQKTVLTSMPNWTALRCEIWRTLQGLWGSGTDWSWRGLFAIVEKWSLQTLVPHPPPRSQGYMVKAVSLAGDFPQYLPPILL